MVGRTMREMRTEEILMDVEFEIRGEENSRVGLV
jgi:hypothetical protein